MSNSATFYPDLGTLSALPLEIRDRIYSYALNFNSIHLDWEPESPCTPRAALLRVSRRIHAEAIVCLYRVNEFGFWVEQEHPTNRLNTSIMRRPGYHIYFAHTQKYLESADNAFFEIPREMLKYIQIVTLNVGTLTGIREYDIVTTNRQTVLGPERPTFVPLLDKMREVCGLLKMCRNIHQFRVSIRSVEKTPGSIEMVLDPLRGLRGIKKTSPVVSSLQDDRWVDWRLKTSYALYLGMIMSMPEGEPPPAYVPDEKEPEEGIFERIGGRWLGGKNFAYPGDSDEDEYDDDDEMGWDDDDDDEFDLFDEMFHYDLDHEMGMAMGYDYDDGQDEEVDEEEDENEDDWEDDEGDDDEDDLPDLV